ncbi:hypothetical protein ETB97_010394 [Aspergillus alliaceus]|uniref:Uncharacterized protein n=1 Tax=Petromyces alliaceus TaxID=209559 RepID=A0A8H6A7R0_PETAA|nr:hypothetical protein ETB97_010394 [Aspergillus burnettii]
MDDSKSQSVDSPIPHQDRVRRCCPDQPPSPPHAESFALTPSTEGTTIDGDGNIYIRDTNLLAIWKVTPEAGATILVQDGALLWTGQMWVNDNKKLWLPASLIHPGGDGLMVDGPKYIFT